jgi:ectoine hydroxylase-related dioxygenase (phytanoyl-CoA dioxygenase family)
LPEAVPIICQPGDVAITNRQAVHGSFANTSPDWRITLNLGFHRRRSVLGVMGGGIHATPAVFDDARIRERARAIGYGIEARRQRFTQETPFVYRPHAESGERFSWDETVRATMKDYNLLDLSI